MNRYVDQKIYRTFEEFEREELRRDTSHESVDEVLDQMFAGALDFEPGNARRKSSEDEQD